MYTAEHSSYQKLKASEYTAWNKLLYIPGDKACWLKLKIAFKIALKLNTLARFSWRAHRSPWKHITWITHYHRAIIANVGVIAHPPFPSACSAHTQGIWQDMHGGEWEALELNDAYTLESTWRIYIIIGISLPW